MEFHNLYQELEQSTEMIHALLSGVTEQEARVKPNAESWSMLKSPVTFAMTSGRIFASTWISSFRLRSSQGFRAKTKCGSD